MERQYSPPYDLTPKDQQRFNTLTSPGWRQHHNVFGNNFMLSTTISFRPSFQHSSFIQAAHQSPPLRYIHPGLLKHLCDLVSVKTFNKSKSNDSILGLYPHKSIDSITSFPTLGDIVLNASFAFIGFFKVSCMKLNASSCFFSNVLSLTPRVERRIINTKGSISTDIQYI